jgi:hypothetical protein
LYRISSFVGVVGVYVDMPSELLKSNFYEAIYVM